MFRDIPASLETLLEVLSLVKTCKQADYFVIRNRTPREKTEAFELAASFSSKSRCPDLCYFIDDLEPGAIFACCD